MERELNSIERQVSTMNVGSVVVLRRGTSAGKQLRVANLVEAGEQLVRRHPSLRRVVAKSCTGMHSFFRDGSSTMKVSDHVFLETLKTDEDVHPLPTRSDCQWVERFHKELHRSDFLSSDR
jgi:hypothetical protein